MAIGTLGAIALGASALGGVASAGIQSSAARRAGQQQAAAAAEATAEQRRQFDAMQQLLAPYVQAGTPALEGLLGAAGLKGPGSQQAFIAEQEQSPMFQALARQGEEAILQRASATGGLRGGNVQGALAQFRPALLNSFFNQQYDRLAGITNMGQNAAAGVGSAGLQTGSNIGNLLMQSGAAQAGATLAGGQAWGNFANSAFNTLGTLAGFGLSGGFGGVRGSTPYVRTGKIIGF